MSKLTKTFRRSNKTANNTSLLSIEDRTSLNHTKIKKKIKFWLNKIVKKYKQVRVTNL